MICMFGLNKVSYDLYDQYIMISEKSTWRVSLELCWNISRENDSLLSQKTRDCKPGREERVKSACVVRDTWNLSFWQLEDCAFIRIFQSVPGAPLTDCTTHYLLASRNISNQNKGSLITRCKIYECCLVKMLNSRREANQNIGWVLLWYFYSCVHGKVRMSIL